MNKKDKDKILKLLIITGLIAVTVFFMFGLSRLSVQIILAVVVLLHYLFIAPNLCGHLYALYDQQIGITKWIPVVNEIQMFSGANYYAALAMSLISVIVFLLRFVPGSAVGSVFGLKAGMFWGYNITAVFIAVLVVTSFVFGFGFCRLLHQLNVLVMERYSASAGKLETIVCYVLLLVPFIRICPLMVMWTKASNMDRLKPADTEAAFVER